MFSAARIVLFFSLLLSGPFRLPAQQVVVDTPAQGEAVQGQVAVVGYTDVEGFQSYEVSFAYQKDETNTWFPIGAGEQVVRGATLATWDTTTMSDGIYRLRVKVFLSDGRTLETVVSGIRVRNYSPVETSTPAPENSSAGAALTQSVDYLPSGQIPTALSANPADVTTFDLGSSLVKGGLVAMALFICLGIYLGIRAIFRRG